MILLFFLVPAGLWARGATEDRIVTARQLVEETRYNEAILILSDVIREEPEKIEAAQELLTEIRLIRNEYNSEYERLIRVLYEEENVEEALRVIEGLEGLDASPNPATVRLVTEARRSARLIFSRQRFNEIMDQGLELLELGDYASALSLYLEGYELQKEEFDAEDYGDLLKADVDRSLAELRDAVNAYIQTEALLISFQNQGIPRLRQSSALETRALLGESLPLLEDLALRLRKLEESARVFASMNQVLLEDPRFGREDFFLSYATLISRGRERSEAPEGIIGTLERRWESLTSDLLGLFRERLERAYGLALENPVLWEDLESLAQTALDLTALWSLRLDPQGTDWSLNPAFLPVLGLNQRFVLYQELSRNGILLREARALLSTALAQDGGDQARRRELVERIARIQEMRGRIQSAQSGLDLRQERAQGLSALGVGDLPVPGLFTAQEQRFDAALRDLFDRGRELLDTNARDTFLALENRLEQLESDYIQAQGFFQGTNRLDDTSGSNQTVLSRYPDQAQELLESQGPEGQELLADAGAYRDYLQNLDTEFLQDPLINDWFEQSLSFLDSVQDWLDRSQGLVQASQALREESLVFRNQGLGLLNQADVLIRQENFNQARNLLGQATGLISQSLSLQEDIPFRRESLELFQEISARILEGENLLVIRDVRQLITQGRQEYFASRFVEAEDLLQRAETRWASTNAQENDEVSYWLSLTRAALSVSTGREILPSNPLYTEMRQLLSLAGRDYQRARELLQQGDTQAAQVYLDSALSKVATVRIPFPLNQEASVLNLRLLEIQDPAGFRELFGRRLEEALAKLASNPDEAFLELTDLASIDPDYPGLRQALRRADLALRPVLAPPDPRNLQEAQRLVAQARTIVNSNNRSLFPTALQQLDRAIQLDPNNTEAVALKDRVQISVGGSATLALDPSAAQLYQEAIERFTQGRILEASAIVEGLLQVPRNQNFPPLQALKQRIDSRL